MKEKNKIPAVFKEDLKKLLQSLNEDEPLLNGDRSCLVCTKIINYDNLQLIIPRSGKTFEYVCNDPVCVEQYNNSNKS